MWPACKLAKSTSLTSYVGALRARLAVLTGTGLAWLFKALESDAAGGQQDTADDDEWVILEIGSTVTVVTSA
jgi:hypothetical protein